MIGNKTIKYSALQFHCVIYSKDKQYVSVHENITALPIHWCTELIFQREETI